MEKIKVSDEMIETGVKALWNGGIISWIDRGGCSEELIVIEIFFPMTNFALGLKDKSQG